MWIQTLWLIVGIQRIWRLMVRYEIAALSSRIFCTASMATFLLAFLVYRVSLLRCEIALLSTSRCPVSSIRTWLQSRRLLILVAGLLALVVWISRCRLLLRFVRRLVLLVWSPKFWRGTVQ